MRATPVKTLTILIALCAFIVANPRDASADDAFLCNDGSIIKVAHDNLEWMKRNNACIAAHFGLKTPSVLIPPLPARRAEITPPRPRAHKRMAQAPAPKTAKTMVKLSAAPAIPDTGAEVPNFRDVVIINASPGKPRVFHHRF